MLPARRPILLLLLVLHAAGCLAGSNSDITSESSRQPTDDAQPGATPGGGLGDGNADAPAGIPFEPLQPESYIGKIKVLLTGMPASAAEMTAGADGAGLDALVQTWMQQPQFQSVLKNFFSIAFQQKGLAATQIRNFIPFGNPGEEEAQAYREMYVRTALAHVNAGLPFNKLITTRQFMVTPYLLRRFAVMDNFDWNDRGDLSDVSRTRDPTLAYTLVPNGGATTIEQFLDVNHANYMRLPYPAIKSPLTPAQCGNCDPAICGFDGSPIQVTQDISFESITPRLESSLRGSSTNFQRGSTPICTLPSGPDLFTQPTDATAWRLVTIKQAAPGEKTLRAWDLPAQRTAAEVILRVPRIGFMTTPAFMGQWTTNVNNQSRVTINQVLTVALNRVFDGSDNTQPADLRAIPGEHASPSSSCYGCHLTMDPMRQYFRQALTLGWSPQQDANQRALAGSYAQGGAVKGGGDLQQLAEQLAGSPLFAPAWTLKVCMWLNSGVCSANDPEVGRIAQDFAANGFDFLKLVRAVATSPLTTYSRETTTSRARGVVLSIARQEQLCQSLSSRLQIADVCNLDGGQQADGFVRAGEIMAAYPATGYSRNTTTWAQPTGPNVLTRMGLENVCAYVAEQVVDAAGAALFASADVPAALDKLVAQVMGAAGDEALALRAILAEHFAAARAQSGGSAAAALKSTFVLACLSPQVSQIGI